MISCFLCGKVFNVGFDGWNTLLANLICSDHNYNDLVKMTDEMEKITRDRFRKAFEIVTSRMLNEVLDSIDASV